jgi:AcrR family transcriptional regulator
MVRSSTAKPDSESHEADAGEERPYHHGALPQALMLAAETVLKRDGLRGLTLRAIAREAGVSHTAPKHHFGDVAGILSELAAVGHRRMAAAMQTLALAQPAGSGRRRAIALGYVRFACDNPDLFRLMSRDELLDFGRPALIEALRGSAAALAGVFDAKPGEGPNPFTGIDDGQAMRMTAAWAYVHGLAMLLVDRQLDSIAAATGGLQDPVALVEATIERISLVLDAPA